MKIRSLFESAEEIKKIDSKNKVYVMTLIQALAEVGWTGKIEHPKPFDEETGEIHPWIVHATSDEDGNSVDFTINGFTYGFKLGTNWHSIGIDEDAESLSKWFITIYEGEMLDIAQYYRDRFDDIVKDAEPSGIAKARREDWARKKCEALIDEFLSNFVRESSRVIRSRKCAELLAPKLKALFDEVWEDNSSAE